MILKPLPQPPRGPLSSKVPEPGPAGGLLNPRLSLAPSKQIPSEILDTLAAAGMGGNPARRSKESRRESFSTHLNEAGASLEELAVSLANGLQDPKTQIQAARLIMDAHGLLSDQSAQAPQIMINIVDSRSAGPQKSLLELIVPNA